MNIVKSTLIVGLLASSLFGGEAQVETKLASDMRSMLKALSEIQAAGFYADEVTIKSATKRLVSNLDSLIESDMTQYLSVKKINAQKFAQKRVRMIEMYADDLLVSVENRDYSDAIEDYSEILRQCVSCHSRLRKDSWQ